MKQKKKRNTAQLSSKTPLRALKKSTTQIQTIKTDIDQLGQQAQGIGQILDVISDIADQTNLLALNAAIEAARAGEAGRGFAVVADEVRKLAEKTMDATKEVGKAISGIQDGTKRNIANVEQSVKIIEKTTELADQFRTFFVGHRVPWWTPPRIRYGP